LSEEEQ